MKPSLGDFADTGASAAISVDRLVESRMLLQAGSGGGKSWALRRVLEQTAGKVQQIVIDPDGEFATLREKFDYVIAAAHDGDALAHPRTAALLARRLLETGVSAIIDIYDLKKHERLAFVRILCETIVDAPKDLWHPVLIAIDEAHVFCPETDKAESAGAVIDLASRGRKRGYSLLAATQRIAKLSKDCAAELHNKLIGLTTLDVDVKRAAFELGLPPAEAMRELRALAPGEFFGFGPALWPTVRKLKTGPVETTHPKAGKRSLRAPPKPTEAIKAVLPKLADLPKEAEAEARTIEDLKRELTSARREATMAKSAKPGASAEDLRAAEARGQERGAAAVQKAGTGFFRQTLRELERMVAEALREAIKSKLQELEARAPTLTVAAVESGRLEHGMEISGTGFPKGGRIIASNSNGHDEPSGSLSKCERAILAVLSQFPEGCEANKLTLLAGYRYTGSFRNSLGALRTAGFITGDNMQVMRITDAGTSQGPFPQLPSQGDELLRYWLAHPSFGICERKIIEALVDAPSGMSADQLCQAAGYEYTGSFRNSLGSLRTAGVLVGRNTETMRLSETIIG